MYSSWSCPYQLYNSYEVWYVRVPASVSCTRLLPRYADLAQIKNAGQRRDKTSNQSNTESRPTPRYIDKDVKLTGILKLDRPCQPRAWPQGFLRCPSRSSLAHQPPVDGAGYVGPAFFFFFPFWRPILKAQIGYTRLEGNVSVCSIFTDLSAVLRICAIFSKQSVGTLIG